MTSGFRLIRARERDALASAAAPAIREWATAWAVAVSGPPSAPGPPAADGEDVWRSAPRSTESESEPWCACRLVEGPAALAAALLRCEETELEAGAPEKGFVATLTERALGDLATRIAAAAPPPELRLELSIDEIEPGEGGETPAQGSAFRPGSGACEIEIPVPGGAIRALASPALVTAFVGSPSPPMEATPGAPALAARIDAIGGQSIRACARLGSAELAVEALAELAVGDVIALDRGLDEPAELALPDLGVECIAHLCEQDGRSALLIEAVGRGPAPIESARGES